MSIDSIKAVVRRFNLEVIEQGSEAAFRELVHPRFVNHSAPPGAPRGPESMWNTFDKVLRPALSDLRVQIHQQVGEADLVTTRKTITGRHTGRLFDLEATGREVSIDVIDMVRLKDGQYLEHWGVNTLASVLTALRKE